MNRRAFLLAAGAAIVAPGKAAAATRQFWTTPEARPVVSFGAGVAAASGSFSAGQMLGYRPVTKLAVAELELDRAACALVDAGLGEQDKAIAAFLNASYRVDELRRAEAGGSLGPDRVSAP